MFVLPLEVENPTRKTAIVVYALLLINTLIAIAILFGDAQSVFQKFGFIPGNPTVTTLISSTFLHAGFLHLLGNMLFLWMFGDNVEDVLGHWLFLAAYLIGGLAAGLGHYLSDPDSAIPCVGASGAVSSVMGMYLVFFPQAKFRLVFFLLYYRVGSVLCSGFIGLSVWIAEQTFLGLFASISGATLSVAFWGHVGGVLAGIIMGLGCRAVGNVGVYQAEKREFMVCPSCGLRRRKRPAGAWLCKRCGAWFRLEEDGRVSLIESGRTSPVVPWAVTGLILIIAGTGVAYLIAAMTQSWRGSPFGRAFVQRPWVPYAIAGLIIAGLASLTAALWIEFKGPGSSSRTQGVKWSCVFVFCASILTLVGIVMGDPKLVLLVGGAVLLLIVVSSNITLSSATESEEEGDPLLAGGLLEQDSDEGHPVLTGGSLEEALEEYHRLHESVDDDPISPQDTDVNESDSNDHD